MNVERNAMTTITLATTEKDKQTGQLQERTEATAHLHLSEVQTKPLDTGHKNHDCAECANKE